MRGACLGCKEQAGVPRGHEVGTEADGHEVPAYLGREGSTLQWEKVVKTKRKRWTRSSRRNRGGDDIT